MDTQKRIEELIEQLNTASEAYYNGKELMSNYEWDALFDELLRLENETQYILPNSPTQSTGADELDGQKEQHEYPALSLAKTKKVEDLKRWAGERTIYLSYKLDGLSLLVTYDNGELTRVLTRGNGRVGTNITKVSSAIYGIPKKISYKGHLIVRGEAVISYKDFERINSSFDDDDNKYANPRNLASGSLALDDIEKIKERHVHFVSFSVVYLDDSMPLLGDRMEFLKNEGFDVIDHMKTNQENLSETVELFTKRVERLEYEYPVDGLVICYEDTEYAQTGSVTGHHATRAGLAFKWQDVVAESTLTEVDWSCAISTISPVAVFEPIILEGTTVSRASLCNITEMKRLGLGGAGTKVQCIKSNKIIPKIIGVTQKVGEFKIPKQCPACGAKTEIRIGKGSNTETLHCTNSECPAKYIQKFTRFVSKTGMDIDGLSVQTIIQFINAGFLKTLPDIYRMEEHFDEIKKMDGFGEKSCANLAVAIEKSKDVHPVSLLYALCIPLIGTDAAKKILSVIGFEGFLKRLEEKSGYEDIEGIGPERSNSILEWYARKQNREEFLKLLPILNVQKMEITDKQTAKLAGLTFVITGDVYQFKNRTELKEYVESQGGSVTGSVSKKTDYLINNDTTSMSAKNQKAKELGIPILSEDEFIEKFGAEKRK